MTENRADIHLGDVGTEYRAAVVDQDGPFDPSSADVKQLIFRMPDGSRVERDAEVQTDGSPATQWFLSYIVEPDDVEGSPAEFHSLEGRITIQAYLEWSDGRKFHSDIRRTDDEGRDLRVRSNL